MPSYGDILNVLLDGSLSTKEIADKLGCTRDQVAQQLRQLHNAGHVEKNIMNPRPHKSHGLIPKIWKVSKRFKENYRKGYYLSVFEIPWIKTIEEKRRAHTGYCQKCGYKHPYPHKL